MRVNSVIFEGNDAICLGSQTLACLASSKCLDKYLQAIAIVASMTCKKFFFHKAMSYKDELVGDGFLFKR